jgi:hypothetical protein
MAPLAAPSQAFIPAWKRLGLKLKNHPPVTEGPAGSAGSGSYETQNKTQEQNTRSDQLFKAPTKSNAAEDYGNVNTSAQNHTVALEDVDGSRTRSLKRKKSVSFTPETKKASVIREPSPNSVSSKSKDSKRKEKKEKKEKPERKDRKPRARSVVDSPETPSYVNYLQDFHTARDHWRFNKAKQTALLKNIFNIFRVPPKYDDAVKSYLLGLQGQAARERLKQSARNILQETKDAGNSTADTIMTASDSHEEARHRALKRQLKATKGRLRDSAATEEARGDEHALKLRKRERAQIVLQALENSISPTPMVESSIIDSLEPAAKRLRSRSRKTKSGVPDDDDTDETSSVESIPSSTDTSSASDDGSGADEGSGQDESSGSSDSDTDENSTGSGSSEASGDSSSHSEESDSD